MCAPFLKTHTPVVQTYTNRTRGKCVLLFWKHTCQLFRPTRKTRVETCAPLLKTHMSVSQTDRKKPDGKCFSSFLENTPISYSDLYKKTRGEMLFRLSWKHTRHLLIATSSQTRVTFTWPLIVIWRFWFFVLTPFNSAPFGCIEFIEFIGSRYANNILSG